MKEHPLGAGARPSSPRHSMEHLPKAVPWLVAPALLLILAGFLVPGGAARPAANAVTFTDPSGDSGPAADITAVEISNDDSGVITLTVGIPNRPTADQLREVLTIAISNDPSAGTKGAYEFVLFAFSDGVAVMRFDGSRFIPFDAPSLRATYASGPTITFNRADFGISTRLAFFAQVRGENAQVLDDAPDGSAAYTYVVTIGPPPLAAGPVTAVPRGPVHGKAFSIRMPVTRTDNNTALSDDGVSVTCSARIRATTLRGRGSYTGGVAGCMFAIPKTSRGKRFVSTITLRFEGATITKTFKARVR